VAGAWRLEDRIGSASALHQAWPAVEADATSRAVARCRVSVPALVLGSSQSERVLDRERTVAAGVEVAKRRSGGGAVLVTPEDPVWIDVWVPAGDSLWRSDVNRAFDWLGEAWVGALGRMGITGLSAHRGGYLSCTRWSGLVCFGGVGTGEVVTDGGRKVVGLAQRRNRFGTLFHSACVLRWDPAALVGLLDLTDCERQAAATGLGAAVVGATTLAEEAGGVAFGAADLADAVVEGLPGH
jgi:lipoate-protein ligase A